MWNKDLRVILPFAKRVLTERAPWRQRKQKPSREPGKVALVYHRMSHAYGKRIAENRISGVKPDYRLSKSSKLTTATIA